MVEQEVTEPEAAEPEATEPEPQSLPEPAPVPLEAPLEEESAPLEEPTETADTAPLEESSEEEPPPPKRVRKAWVQPEPRARAEPKANAKPKAEPKRRGRPPGARNIVREPAPVQDPLEQIMTSMRERRQAHQERQHTFFQSFLPA